MNVFLWVIQGVLAVLLVAGGATKVFKFEELAQMPANRALSRGAWRLVGILELLGAVLLVVPAAVNWMPELTPFAAVAVALECLGLAALAARHSLKLAASNPLVWSAAMGLMAVLVAYGRYALSPFA